MKVPGVVRRSRLALIIALAGMALASCVPDAMTGTGRQPPYLAIVVLVDAPPAVTTRGPYTFRVRELSGTLNVDTTFRAAPKDTIILPVAAATYRVDISDVPPTCGVRDGTAQVMVVPPNTNTSLIRFSLNCTPALVVAAYSDGAKPDSAFVVSVKNAAGTETAALVPANDTVVFDRLPAGKYDVTLRHVADNCVVISDGGSKVSVAITPSGGAFVPFRIVCAEVAKRPRIVLLAGSYDNGSIGYVIRATDPDMDIERTFVDVTDCNQRSILTGGGRRRGGFSGMPNVSRRDTAVIIGAYDLEVPDSLLAGRCLGTWVADERGNTSEFVEVPLLKRDPLRSPIASPFNARSIGSRSIVIDAAITDPTGDYLGMFVVYIIRDGVLGAGDGVPDRVVVQPAGLIGTVIPEFLVGIGYGAWNDYFGAIVYLVDKAGNFTRLQDFDLFH